MNYEFLKNFDTRMERVGSYALLYKNSMQKTTWKKYGFEEIDEQTNVIFMVLLYVMEQSLKDEPCTMDDIGDFIDHMNMDFLKKELSYEECKGLAGFIVNTILADEGKAMYFKGFNFSERKYKEIHISFLTNEIIYLDDTVRRTSYKLSNDGYSLMLSTLEMESNMRLTIHEFIFKMHLEKQSYGKALEEIKSIFNLLRIQLQKMKEALQKIRQNALSYSVQEYRDLMNENLLSLDNTKKKFDGYKNQVKQRIYEYEEENINIKKLDETELENLNDLKIIESYLVRSIEEQQKILLAHFDLKEVYGEELEALTQMTLIKRFNIQTDFYDKILENVSFLENMHFIFKPLLLNKIDKKYNINKAFQYQKSIVHNELEDDEELLSFDEKDWEEEQIRLQKEKLATYNRSLEALLRLTYERGSISLKDIQEQMEDDQELAAQMVPTVEIFREIIIELLKNKVIKVQELREEMKSYTNQWTPQFQLNESILHILEEQSEWGTISFIHTTEKFLDEKVKFKGFQDKQGNTKTLVCSNVLFEVRKEGSDVF